MFGHPQWERSYFTFQDWQPGEVWCSLEGPTDLSETLARQFFWEQVREHVERETVRMHGEGWQFDEPASRDTIKLRRTLQIDWQISAADVLLGFMTLGIGLLIQLLSNTPRRYVRYYPVQIRVPIRRRVSQEVPMIAYGG